MITLDELVGKPNFVVSGKTLIVLFLHYFHWSVLKIVQLAIIILTRDDLKVTFDIDVEAINLASDLKHTESIRLEVLLFECISPLWLTILIVGMERVEVLENHMLLWNQIKLFLFFQEVLGN